MKTKTIIRMLSVFFTFTLFFTNCTTEDMETENVFNSENQLTTEISTESKVESLEDFSQLVSNTSSRLLNDEISSAERTTPPPLPCDETFTYLPVSVFITYNPSITTESQKETIRSRRNVILYSVIDNQTELWSILLRVSSCPGGNTTSAELEDDPDILSYTIIP